MPVKAPLPGGASDLSLPLNGGVPLNGTVYPQITGNDALTNYSGTQERIVALQQFNSGANVLFPPQVFYVLHIRQAHHDFHPEMTALTKDKLGSIIWGYDGIYPGPTFISRYGVPILVRIMNELFKDKAANAPLVDANTDPRAVFGDVRISTHLHNGHSASESDGNPMDYYPPTDPDGKTYPKSIQALLFRDHHYPMFRAGRNPKVPATVLRSPNVNDGDPRETVSTLWYHDHSHDFTASNVYKGLVGFHLFFDEADSGNESDPTPKALRLPSGDFDIPLLFQDKRFNAQGELILDDQSHQGFLGDKFIVNGKIQPKLTVLRRKYRFRLLNAGPSRYYQFFFTKNDVDLCVQQIGNDESLLEQPEDVRSVLLGVAERADVVIDFKQFNKGDQVFLVNRLKMRPDGTGPVANVDPDDGHFINFEVWPPGLGDQILRFDVGDDAVDPSQVPARLRPAPPLPDWLPSPLTPENLDKLMPMTFTFDSKGGWVINDKLFDPTFIGAMLTQGPPAGTGPDGVVWKLKNAAPSDWSHPVHIHLEEFRILLRDRKPPDRTEQSKKDVLILRPNEEVYIFLRSRDFLGKYPIHCHNVVHEDHAMMMRFDVK